MAVTCASLLCLMLSCVISVPCCFAATVTRTSVAYITANATSPPPSPPSVAYITVNATSPLPSPPTYQSNIHTLLTALSQAANGSSTPVFYNTSVGNTTSSAVYGIYLCRGDVTGAACRDCVSAAASALPGKCQQGRQAVIWYDECIIRYSNETFLHRLDTSHNYTNPSNTTVTVNSTMLTQVLSTAAEKAANGSSDGTKFVAEQTSLDGSNTVNVQAQCTPDLSTRDCNRCLNMSIGMLPECCANKQGGRVLFPSCNLRYQLYGSSAPVALSPAPPPENGGTPPHGLDPHQWDARKPPRRNLPGIISGSVGVLMILLLTIVLWLYLQQKKAQKALEDVRDIITAESLQMEFNTIRAATQNFAADRKLGQGGFGEVYKGTLENGQEIAVKRLSRNSGQGAAEFKTEVLLVAKLQHRNLVKLLGFCVSGKEKILVYEYLPNSSLDKFLFDPTKRVSLSWETRFKIIYGIARGLLYLHEDSRLKIVHRDLKTSNILLDEAMNPKIADFGLAKLFGVDQTQDETNTIVGTYGYMAPEYILTGHYSVKSDVYTFGIIVLEVVSGQRNKYLNRSHLEEALLHRAWRLWTEDEALKLVDETLGDNYSLEDVMKCIHIGLLCIQENAARRPTMISVVAALGGQTIKLPSPTPPNFLAPADRVSGNNTSTSGSNPGQAASVYTTSDISILDPR